MIKIMIENHGIGLAANQVGIDGRIFVMKPNNDFLVVINPVILDQSNDEVLMTEGCLSFDNQEYSIYRPTWIKVGFYNKYAQWGEYKFQNIEARCFLHENDHLSGITFDTIATL